MPTLYLPQIMFIFMAFAFQAILIYHFALRKWRFELAICCGWLVYVASIPAAFISVYLLLTGMSWFYWLGGVIYLVWANYGYYVEYIRHIQWRSPARWSVLGPYITLYLAAVMFYWWPLALIYKPLWYAYGLLFLTSTFLNVTSHKGSTQVVLKEGST